MIMDALAQFADAQENTLSVAHTNVIDTLAGGDSYEGSWFVFRVDTAFTAGAGAPTLTVQLQTSDQEAFTGGADTLVQSAAYLAAALTAGALYAVRIPPGAKRYLRGYNVVDSGASSKRFSAGKWDSFIVNDLPIDIDRRKFLANA